MIGLTEGIGLTKSNKGAVCIVCHNWCFNHNLNFKNQFVMAVMTY